MTDDPVGEFFEDYDWTGTQFGHVYRLTAPKRKEWTREDEELYDQVSLSMEYMREREKGFDDD